MNEPDEQRARRTAEEIQLVLEGYLVNQQKHEVANILAAAFAAVREECAKVADRNVYMSEDCDEGGHFGGPSSCEYGCGKVIAAAIRGAGEAHGASWME